MFKRLKARFLGLLTLAVAVPGVASAAVGDGTADSVTGDSVSEVGTFITDNVIEHAPTYITLFFLVFGLGLAMSALVMYSRKAKRALMSGRA